jgi:hypothetical protein
VHDAVNRKCIDHCIHDGSRRRPDAGLAAALDAQRIARGGSSTSATWKGGTMLARGMA